MRVYNKSIVYNNIFINDKNKKNEISFGNVYLDRGRKVDMNKVDKTIKNFRKEPFSEKCERWITNLKNIITGKNKTL